MISDEFDTSTVEHFRFFGERLETVLEQMARWATRNTEYAPYTIVAEGMEESRFGNSWVGHIYAKRVKEQATDEQRMQQGTVQEQV